MDPNKSLSAKLLNNQVYPIFNTTLMPTLLNHYGLEDNFWMLKDKMATKWQATSQNVVYAF